LWRMAEVLPLERTVLLTHDVEMLVNRQNALMERNLYSKIRIVRRWLSERREEIQAYHTFRRILTLTERDRAAVQVIAGKGTPVEVLPFGMDPGDYPDLGIERNRREILFVGVMTSSFNKDALEFFIRWIHPQIEHLEDLKTTIVGGWLPKELEYFQKVRGVEITGKVLDVRPYLARAGCIVIPLRFGGGLRTRVLEAMFSGLPVICTAVAMAGMPFEPERDYLQADSPEEFGHQIERLLNSTELATQIANSAKEKVLKLYSRSTQADKLESMLLGFINS
jgi:glycosyltransferase involved in cell wall biosynthesis